MITVSIMSGNVVVEEHSFYSNDFAVSWASVWSDLGFKVRFSGED